MRSIKLLLVLAAITIAGCAFEGGNGSNVPGQRAALLSRDVKIEMDYLLYLPDSYGDNDKSWPLMVFLHGAGERGGDVEIVKRHGPPKLVAEGKKLPFIIVSPQCPSGKWWPALSTNVMILIDEIVEKYNVDQTRIYLTGLSMGGYGSWAIGCDSPDRFAAIAPICGSGKPIIARHLKDVPVWAFHGAKDDIVPLEESESMVDAINRAGGNARLTVYPEAGHDSFTQTYNNEEFYKWLLSHSKKQ